MHSAVTQLLLLKSTLMPPIQPLCSDWLLFSRFWEIRPIDYSLPEWMMESRKVPGSYFWVSRQNIGVWPFKWNLFQLFAVVLSHCAVFFMSCKHTLNKMNFFSPKVNQSKRNIFLFTCPSDKHYIKFGCPIPKSSYPKSFARFLSQMELVKTNEMVAV